MVKDNKKINEKELDAVVGGDFGKRASSSKDNCMLELQNEKEASTSIAHIINGEKDANNSSMHIINGEKDANAILIGDEKDNDLA